jgi:hypothetical protein
MNLIDSASLVVTPNGYKTSKLYSIVPSDGTGDMTFARTGDTATRVNSSGLIETVLADKPRLDYLGGGCSKLLLEPQRTNSQTRSNDFTNAEWTKENSAITASFATSPDGTTNASRLLPNTGVSSSYYGLYSTLNTASSTQTHSVFVKANGYSKVVLYNRFTDQQYSVFNLATGTLIFNSANAVGKIENYGNGWYRISSLLTNASQRLALSVVNPNYTSGSPFSNWAANGTDSILVYGAQKEVGSTFATSYIPTTTASVTRNADSCTKSSISSLIGQTEGTMFIDLIYDANKIETGQVLIPLVLSQSTTNSAISLYKDGRVQATHRNSGTLTCNIDLTSYGLTNSRHKIAFAYKLNDFVLYIDGVLAGSDTVGTVGAQDSISLKDTTFPSIGLTNSVALWKTRLTNQELVTLTSL